MKIVVLKLIGQNRQVARERLPALDKTITAQTVYDEILQEITQLEHDENEKLNVRVLISR